MSNRQIFIGVLAAINVVIYVLFLYFPLLSSGYVWDDLYFLKDIAAGQGDGSQPGIFIGTNFYRPVGYLSFLVESRWFGIDPRISHLINIALHEIVVLQVGLLAFFMLAGRPGFYPRLLFASILAVFVGSLPFMAEPVAWVSARFEILCAIFVMAALIWCLWVPVPWLAGAGAGIFFMLALSSKEAAVPLVLVLPLLAFLRQKQRLGVEDWSPLRSPGFWWPAAAVSGVFLVYVITRDLVLDKSLVSVNTMADITLSQHAVLVGDSLIQYATMLVTGRDLQSFYAAHPASSFGVKHLLAILAYALSGLACCVQFVRTRHPGWAMPLAFLIMLSPVINLMPIFPDLFSVAPRYLYVPVLVLAVFMLVGIMQATVLTARFWGVSVLLLSGLVFLHQPQVRAFIAKYQTDEQFWNAIVEQNGIYHRVVANSVISAKMAVSRYDEAEQLLQLARKNPGADKWGLDYYAVPLAYYLNRVTAQTMAEIDGHLDESASGTGLLTLQPAVDERGLTRWLNMKALMLHNQCADWVQIDGLAQAAQHLSPNPLSPLLLLAIRQPALVGDWGVIAGQGNPFASEYQQKMSALLVRDQNQCGLRRYTSLLSKLEVSQRPPPIFWTSE